MSEEDNNPDGVNHANDEMFTRETEDSVDARDRPSLGITDFVRKKLESTVEQVQTTGNLSKDALTYVIQQGDKGRKEVLRIVAQEVGDFLKNTDLSQEITKVLTGLKIDVNASIAFRANESGDGVKPEIESQVELGGTPEETEEAPN